MGRDTRYIVTNLEGGRGKHLYEKLYSARGQAENHIKAWKTHLASDRTWCSQAHANQMRVRRAYAAPPGPRSRLTAARCRLLDVVEIARRLSEEIPMAPRPVRHTAPASRQDRGHHRRKEDPDHPHDAGVLPTARAPAPALRCARPAKISLTHARPDHPETETTDPKQANARRSALGRKPRLRIKVMHTTSRANLSKNPTAVNNGG